MFEGVNTLEINQATMKKAMQYWLNSEMLQSDVEVESVKHLSDGSFSIQLKDNQTKVKEV